MFLFLYKHKLEGYSSKGSVYFWGREQRRSQGQVWFISLKKIWSQNGRTSTWFYYEWRIVVLLLVLFSPRLASLTLSRFWFISRFGFCDTIEGIIWKCRCDYFTPVWKPSMTPISYRVIFEFLGIAFAILTYRFSLAFNYLLFTQWARKLCSLWNMENAICFHLALCLLQMLFPLYLILFPDSSPFTH